MIKLHRRDFIRTSLFGGIAAASIPVHAWDIWDAQTKNTLQTNSRVSLVTGSDRADMAFRALQPFSNEIIQAIGKKRIIIKPNFVDPSIQLCATHKETMEGILEFYKSIKKLDDVVIAESTADGPTMVAYDNFGFIPVAEKYNVKLIDLDETPIQLLYLLNELTVKPQPVRVSSLLMDRNNFIMSVTRLKTHNFVFGTYTLKNVAVGAPIKDAGFILGRNNPTGVKSDKMLVHGSGFTGTRALNYNLFTIAQSIRPDLGFIDGYDGMEGQGPVNGTVVDHRVCVAGLDWMAVDRIGVELMGIDPAYIGYLNFCADAGFGQFDINKIEIIGEKVANHVKNYQLAKNIELQLEWMTPLSRERRN